MVDPPWLRSKIHKEIQIQILMAGRQPWQQQQQQGGKKQTGSSSNTGVLVDIQINKYDDHSYLRDRMKQSDLENTGGDLHIEVQPAMTTPSVYPSSPVQLK
jgi:hypothetical protein